MLELKGCDITTDRCEVILLIVPFDEMVSTILLVARDEVFGRG
jgi:hypothetical protein